MTSPEVVPGPDTSVVPHQSLAQHLIAEMQNVKLAPGVRADAATSWIKESHYGPTDYQETEGVVSWDLARSKPEQIQYVRTYQIKESKTQPRTDMLRDEARIGRMILDIAVHGVDEPIKVREGKNGEIIIVAGHTRLFCAINAGLKVIPCKFETEDNTNSPTRILLREMKTNLFRQDMNESDKAAAYLRILDSSQQESGDKLTNV